MGWLQRTITLYSCVINYLRLLNAYRYVVLCTSSDQAINKLPENQKQVEPKVLFNFIEKELTDCLSILPIKNGQSGNGIQQGQCTKAFAAGLLVRLYLNAEKWIGEAKWSTCEEMCARITREILDIMQLLKLV